MSFQLVFLLDSLKLTRNSGMSGGNRNQWLFTTFLNPANGSGMQRLGKCM
jgi:hypothetical protein